MKKHIDLNKIILCTSYIYIAIPIIIFMFGWLKWYIALLGTSIILFCLYRMCQGSKIKNKLTTDKKNIKKLILIFFITVLWVYFSGIGGFVYQNDDHIYRNGLFDLLVNKDWPVVGKGLVDGKMTPLALVYYIGFWLPAALFGKIFGITAGYCFQTIWATIGIFLFYYFVCTYFKKIRIWPLIIFIFFSGLDILGFYALGTRLSQIDPTAHLEWWTDFQFSSFTTQLFWVFNQAIPAWLILMLILNQEDNKYIVFLTSLLLIYSTFPLIGILPFVIYLVLAKYYKKSKTVKEYLSLTIKKILTIENTLGALVVGITTFLYLKTNLAGQNFELIEFNKANLFAYITFILIEISVYFFILYKYNKKNPLYYISLIILLICPLIVVGHGDDFCMRVSIPALVILYLLVIKALDTSYYKKEWLVFVPLIIILLIGCATPIHEFKRTMNMTNISKNKNEQLMTYTLDEKKMFSHGNFSGKLDNVFFKYLSRNGD